MRFFKAFNLLHRRTKSDTFVSGSALESATKHSEPPSRRSIPVSLFDLVTSQIPANFKHLSDRDSGSANVTLPIFGLESELNARLLEANNRWAKEYAGLQCQLQECREELLNERRKVQCLQCKLEEDNRIILDLRISSGRGVSNLAATGSPQDRLQPTISDGTGMLLNVPTMPNVVKGSSANVMNIRTMDEYSSALRMTLATRKELRDQKKVTLFWKRKALDRNQLQSIITPSVSTISSIYDPLPVGRQIALDMLISRRGLDSTLGSKMRWRDTSSSPPKMVIRKLSTYQPADGVGGPIATARLPAVSSENSRSSRLEPLASESIKADISSLYGSPDSLKHLVSGKRPSLGPSLIGRLTKFTFATSTPSKTDLAPNVESFGDLHTIFATTFGVDKLLVDESHSTLNQIDMEDELCISMTSVLPPPTAAPVSSGPPTRSVFKSSHIPTRRVTAGNHNEVATNTLKQASRDCTSRRSWKSYKTRPATGTKAKIVPEGSVSPERALGSQKSGRDKENSFVRAIPIFKRKISSATQNHS